MYSFANLIRDEKNIMKTINLILSRSPIGTLVHFYIGTFTC
jgi:hypothetical protein